MNLTFWITVALIVAAIMLVAGVVWTLAIWFLRAWINAFATSLEAQAPRRALTIIHSEHNREIVGDGAWNAQPARPRPRTARVRDIEPRGC